jgi:hypothetical protein
MKVNSYYTLCKTSLSVRHTLRRQPYGIKRPLYASWATVWRSEGSLFFVGYLTTLSLSRLIASDARMMNKWWILKDLEGNGHCLTRYYHGICLEGLKETIKNLTLYSPCLDRDSNRALPGYKSRALLLDRRVRSPKDHRYRVHNHWVLAFTVVNCWC